MPDAPKTQHRSVRIEDDDWADLERVAQSQGLDRAKVINQLVRWYLRRPGAKPVTRPKPAHD
jgi:predicted DNA-binding ribbon-helix-helix protein